MGELKKEIIVVTGATGYLGKRVVMYAVECGYHVRAIVRPGRSGADMPWSSSPNVDVMPFDLADQSFKFSNFIGGGDSSLDLARVVIHTAGIMTGTSEQQDKNTVEPIRRLILAMADAGCSRLVHISSLSVYGYAAMPDDSQLDELTPIEPDIHDRDNYCKAKYKQEQIIMHMAQAGLVKATVLRPGVIYGYERLWTARLGIKKAGVLLQINRSGTLPLTFVENCAEAVVLAACRDNNLNDVYIKPNLRGTNCGFEAINIIDDCPPTQDEYLSWMSEKCAPDLKLRICIPWWSAKLFIECISLLQITLPTIYRRVPLILKKATFNARWKKLRYSNARLKDRLGWEQNHYPLSTSHVRGLGQLNS